MPAQSASADSHRSPMQVGPVTWYVSTLGSDTNDCLSPASPCQSINAAITLAANGDTIKVAAGTYTGTGTEVVLVNKSLTLSGSWDETFSTRIGTSTIDGEGVRRGILAENINSDVPENILLEFFTIQNGYADYWGGGIYTIENLTINNSLITNNKTEGRGGGISTGHNLTINNSMITNNKAKHAGGGIDIGGGNNHERIVIINSSSIIHNATVGGGQGGGIYKGFGSAIINNSTISNNSAYNGGGIFNSYPLTVNSSTISNNSAVDIGGVSNYGLSSVEQFVFRNTLIAQNTGRRPDCNGADFVSLGYNLVGNTTSCNFPPAAGDILNKNPKLGKLINGSGYVPLQSGSPAIDAGNPSGCKGNGVLTTDQRGMPRVGRCDIGAYEYALPGLVSTLTINAGNDQTSPPSFAYPKAFQVAVLDNYGTPIPNVTVSFTAPASGPGGIFSTTGTNFATSISNGDGLATAPAFIANDQLGAFFVTASTEGVASIDFNATNSVWYVATTGNDSNSCLAPDAPCATINGAINKAGSGDSIFVAAGTYTYSGSQSALIDYVVLIDKDIYLYGGWSTDFTLNNGKTIIDARNNSNSVRVGFLVMYFLTAKIENFSIQNGWGGGIINRYSNLTLQKIIVDQGDNTGIENDMGILTMSNSTISRNNGYFNSGGVVNTGWMLIQNSTVSGNISKYSDGGISNYGTLTIKNSTITNNIGDGNYPSSGGILNDGGTVILQNTILAGNSIPIPNGPDCIGTITSLGYNLIGNNEGCNIISMPSDQIGTSTAPIDPRITDLQDNGGFSLTHSLLTGSPAVNGGSPETPGSSNTACLATDQRGAPRPYGSICDIGALELNHPIVRSVTPGVNSGQANPVVFTVKFLAPVIGVDMTEPFDDFTLITSGLTSASITSVTGAGDTYFVTVNPVGGPGNGTIRLDVVDNDNITDLNSTPLGGAGTGNGNFTSGQVYSFLQIPLPLSPWLTITVATPTYTWSPIPNATQYQYQLMKGQTVVFTRTVSSNVCGPTVCSDTPPNLLVFGNYKWKIQAKIGSTWADYSFYKKFIVSSAKAGLWNGNGVEFYISTTNGKVKNFSINLSVYPCGIYKITHTPFEKIKTKNFSFGGPFYANGTFSSTTNVLGTLGLKNFYISGCGYLTGGPFGWSATWKNKSQPPAFSASAEILPSITVIPEPDIFTMRPFVIEKVEP